MSSKIQWFAERWAERLGPAISAMTGERSSARTAPDLPAARAARDCICVTLDFDLAANARISVIVSQAAWAEVGKSVLAAAGIEDAQAEELESTFIEVLQQSLSPLAQFLTALAGREVAAGVLQRTADPEALSEWVGVLLDLKGTAIGEAWISVSKEMQDALDVKTDAPQQGAPCPEPQDQTGGLPGRTSKTLGLLLEVELPVGVSFGRTQMRLKDAIKLSTGSIVELNRTITEPVEIIVNNCVIARGEVVVVEGNYGVRIKEIVSREERLRTLF